MRRLLHRRSVSSLVPLVLVAFACSSGGSSGDDDTSSGAQGGTGTGAVAGMSAGAKGGTAGAGGSGATGGSAAGSGGSSAGMTSAGQGGSAGAAAGSGGSSGSGATAGIGAAGGSAGAPTAGTGGSAGSTLGGNGGMPATGGIGGAPGAGTGGTAGSGGPPMCPTGALFCSGFEDAMLPTGATYLSSNDNNDWTKGTKLDTTVFNSGKQSIEILKIQSYSQREIVVPAAQKFWFRAYFRTDVGVGGPTGNNHNLFFEAAWQGGDKGVEIVEEDCMLGMNIADTRYGSNGTKNQPGCPTTGDKGTQLAANTWYCIEGFFDGTAGDAQVYVDGDKVMDLANEAGAKNNYSTLRFGYRQYHDLQRLVWYDDVATAADRIGCH
jgi:hypothetical protein